MTPAASACLPRLCPEEHSGDGDAAGTRARPGRDAITGSRGDRGGRCGPTGGGRIRWSPFGVLLAFVAYATYAAVANRNYYRKA